MSDQLELTPAVSLPAGFKIREVDCEQAPNRNPSRKWLQHVVFMTGNDG